MCDVTSCKWTCTDMDPWWTYLYSPSCCLCFFSYLHFLSLHLSQTISEIFKQRHSPWKWRQMFFLVFSRYLLVETQLCSCNTLKCSTVSECCFLACPVAAAIRMWTTSGNCCFYVSLHRSSMCFTENTNHQKRQVLYCLNADLWAVKHLNCFC